MRAVLQRAANACVELAGEILGEIGHGVVALVGIAPGDGAQEAEWLADKIANMRIFSDEHGKMNLSLLDVGGAALVVSQFTLYGDARRGRRPSFINAAQGPDAEAVYEAVVRALRGFGVDTATGRFGAMMDVTLTNQGPVTILLDSDKLF